MTTLTIDGAPRGGSATLAGAIALAADPDAPRGLCVLTTRLESGETLTLRSYNFGLGPRDLESSAPGRNGVPFGVAVSPP